MDWGSFLVGVMASVYRGLSLLGEDLEAERLTSAHWPLPKFLAYHIECSIVLIAFKDAETYWSGNQISDLKSGGICELRCEHDIEAWHFSFFSAALEIVITGCYSPEFQFERGILLSSSSFLARTARFADDMALLIVVLIVLYKSVSHLHAEKKPKLVWVLRPRILSL